jgi:class 3 adenylate cyclase
VIGRKKFIYDLWGDAVNMASRMESHGEPSRIQVTQAVVDAIGDRFVFEARGPIEVKGAGR